MLHRFVTLLTWFLLLAHVAGCATSAPNPFTPVNRAEQLIAGNLVQALVQLSDLDPATTRLQMAEPADGFGKSLQRELRMVGYGLQSRRGDGDPAEVRYSVARHVGNTDREMADFQISVGDVRMKRRYRLTGEQAQPASDLYVLGRDATSIRLNDSMFTNTVEPADATKSLRVRATPDAAPVSAVPVSQAGLSSPGVLPPVSPEALAPADVTGNNLAVEHPAPGIADAVVIDMSTDSGLDPVVYRVGEPIALSVTTSRDSDLYCFYRDGHGDVVRLFPNRYTPDSRVKAGATLHLPGSDAWEIRATGSGLTDEVMCLASGSSKSKLPASLVGASGFTPLPVDGLQQIVDDYQRLNGEEPARRIIAVEVI